MAVTATLVRSEEEEAGGAEDPCVGAGAAGNASSDLGVQALWVQVMAPGATTPPQAASTSHRSPPHEGPTAWCPRMKDIPATRAGQDPAPQDRTIRAMSPRLGQAARHPSSSQDTQVTRPHPPRCARSRRSRLPTSTSTSRSCRRKPPRAARPRQRPRSPAAPGRTGKPTWTQTLDTCFITTQSPARPHGIAPLSRQKME